MLNHVHEPHIQTGSQNWQDDTTYLRNCHLAYLIVEGTAERKWDKHRQKYKYTEHIVKNEDTNNMGI